MLAMSSLEILSFAGLFTVIFVFTGSPFVLGGALSCGVVAIKHLRLARRTSLRQVRLHTSLRPQHWSRDARSLTTSNGWRTRHSNGVRA